MGVKLFIFCLLLQGLKADDNEDYGINICENPIKIGTHFAQVPDDYLFSFTDMGRDEFGTPMVNTHLIGEGSIVAFECLVDDVTAESKFLVLRPVTGLTDTYELVCFAEAKGAVHYPHLKDFIPLRSSCEVNSSDMLGYINKDPVKNRCKVSNALQSSPIKVSGIDYDAIAEGDIYVFESDTTDLLIPIFTALYQCNCEEKLVGPFLRDRKEIDAQDFQFISEIKVPNQSYIMGIAIYSESLEDQSLQVSIEGCPEVLTPKNNRIGVEEMLFSTPCFTGNSERKIYANSSSQSSGYSTSRIGYSTVTPNPDRQTITTSGTFTDREYSVSAILGCPRSIKFTDGSIRAPEFTLNSGPYISVDDAVCIDDFTIENTNWDISNLHDEDLFGPHIYIDLENPLKKGFLLQWNHHSSEAKEDDYFFPVVWRKVTNSLYDEYKIVCRAFSKNDEEGHIRKTFPTNNCTTKEGDFVGFIFNGREKVPLSGTIAPAGQSNYLTVEDNTGFATFTPAIVGVPYSFKSANSSIKYNINAVVCTVGFEPYFNDTYTYDDIQDNITNVSNLPCPREYDESDAFILIDELNPVPGSGYVIGFTHYLTRCNENDPIMLMVRPNTDGGHDIICKKNISGCPEGSYVDNLETMLEERCKVEEGDLLALAMMSSGEQQIPYHEVEGYPCSFADILFQELPDICERKYSIGYMFQRDCLVDAYGNRLIDRYYDVFDKEFGYGEKLLYIDYSTDLEDGFIGSFETHIEGQFESILFFIDDKNGSTTSYSDLSQFSSGLCQTLYTSNGSELGDISIEPSAPCFAKSYQKLGVLVTGWNKTLGFTCNSQFSSYTNSTSNGNFSDLMQTCGGNVQMSLRVVMKCGSDLPLTILTDNINNESATPPHYPTTSQDFWRQCDILISQRIYGTVDTPIPVETKGQRLYLDNLEALDEGYLVKWTIKIASSSSPIIPVIWRKVESTDNSHYRIVCKGYSDDSSLRTGDFEDIYPESTCNVKEGDFSGFITLASYDSISRIAAFEDLSGTYLSSVYDEISFTSFINNGIYTLNNKSNDDTKYALETTVCLTLNENQACPGQSLSSSVSLGSLSFTQTSPGKISYVDTSNPLPIGELVSWNLKVSDKLKTLYVTIWKKINDQNFEVKCVFYLDDMTYFDDEVDIRPDTRCFVDDEDHYVGFISFEDSPALNYVSGSGTKAMQHLPDSDMEASVGSVSTFAELSEHPKIFEYIELSPRPDYHNNRLYSIGAKICPKQEFCIGDTDIDATNNLIETGYYILSVESQICIGSIKVNASSVGTLLFSFNSSNNIETLEFSIEKTGINELTLLSQICLEGPESNIYMSHPPLETAPIQTTLTLSDGIDGQNQSNNITEHFPVQICYFTEQVIGFYDIPNLRERALNIMPNEVNEKLVYFSDSMIINIDGTIDKFSAYLDEPGEVTFLVLDNVTVGGVTTYKISQYRTFTSEFTGPIQFDSTQNPMSNVVEGQFLGVYCDPRIVSVTFSEENEVSKKLRIDGSEDIFIQDYELEIQRIVPVKPLIQANIKINVI